MTSRYSYPAPVPRPRGNRGFHAGTALILGALVLVTTAAVPRHAAASVGGGTLIPFPGKSKIQKLEWRAPRVSFEQDPRTGASTATVVLEGVYGRAGWDLLWKHGNLKRPRTGEFTISFPLKIKASRISLAAIGPQGEVEEEIFVYTCDEGVWSELAEQDQKAPPKRFSYSFGAGFTYLKYTESPWSVRVTEGAVTVKANVAWAFLPSPFDIGANAFINALPLFASADGLPGFRVYGINGRVAYWIPRKLLDLTWGVMAGWYFWGMLVPGAEYGVNSLTGPQLFVTARHIPLGGRVAFGYFKIAPISTRPGNITLSSREFAAGGGYQLWRPPKGSKMPSWTATLDVSHTFASSEEQGNSLDMLTTSLGVQAGW